MSIDWSEPGLAFLRTQLLVGRVSLFAGAGFSLGARNKFAEPLPLGGTLAELLARKAGIDYHNESLPTVFEAVEPMIGTKHLWNYLSELYSVVQVESWYRTMASLTWFRIYTTNIDDLFQYLRPLASGQVLDTIVRGDYPQERDPHFERLQCIHLHGHILYRSNGLTFTLPDFARHTARPDPWYQELVSDLYSMPILFIGSSLEEPILTHYLELREQRPFNAEREYRPKSFLVIPHVGPIRAASLKTRNIAPIEASAEEFFLSLSSHLPVADLHVTSVQSKVWPHLFAKANRVGTEVSKHFDPIIADSLPIVKSTSHSHFFLGAEPIWADINERRDADRQISNQLMDEVQSATTGFKCIVLHGPAGSGKTTTLMRVAVDLAVAGSQVFFARGIERLDLSGILKLADSIKDRSQRVVVFVDVISRHIGAVASRVKEVLNQTNLSLVLADRTNRYASRCQQLASLSPVEIAMPDLDESDVISVLDRLTTFGFLGALRNRSRSEQVNEFMIRAKRQMLVALREATSGKEFDAILMDEYSELTSEAQLAYTICCIAVAKGAPGVYRRHLMPCIPRSRFVKGVVIEDLLRGVLVSGNETGTLLKPRHGLIAQWIANEVAPLEMRFEAVTTFLVQVSNHIVPTEIKKRSPAFLAYRGMVNCEGLYELFGGDTSTMLQIYADVRSYYDGDFLFWLQYAMAHIKAGNLDVAENYLNQSLSIAPHSHQTLHQKGILYLMQATGSEFPVTMLSRAQEGMDILLDQIRQRGDHDSYPYHAYLTHVGRWYTHADALISQTEWEKLRLVGKEALNKYRLDDNIMAAAKEIEQRYLRRAVKKPHL